MKKDHEYKIYGGDKGIYSDDSNVCMAGLHHGVISDIGGDFELKIVGEQTGFKGSD